MRIDSSEKLAQYLFVTEGLTQEGLLEVIEDLMGIIEDEAYRLGYNAGLDASDREMG